MGKTTEGPAAALWQVSRDMAGRWRTVENGFSAALLALIALLPLAEGAGRIFGIGNLIPGSILLVQHFTLVVAMAGGALAARDNRLLALSTAAFVPSRFKLPAQVFAAAVGVAICTCLAYGAWTFAMVERAAEDTVAFGLPVWVFILVMAPGFAAIAARMAWRASPSLPGKALALAGVLVPIALASWETLGELPILQYAVVALIAGALLGLPIFAVIGGLAAMLFWYEYTPVTAVPLAAYQLSGQPLLPAIPLFTLGGYILAEGGSSRRLVRVFSALVGWVPGGLAVTTALAFAFFTSFTGASGVTILSLGGLIMPVLAGARYTRRFSLGLMTASGSIGLLFPPSLAVILYAVYSRTPINELFLGGLLPGILLVGLVALWGVRHGRRAEQVRRRFDPVEARAAVAEAKWELLLPVVVIGGIFGGIVTLVEAAAVTVLYAFVIECIVHRDLPIRGRLPAVAAECATLVGGVLLILGVALGFTNYLIDAQIPDQALEWVQAHIESKYVFLLVLNALLLVVGCMMDIFSAILVVVPLIAPMGEAFGVDPVHLGIIFLANLELGYLTPPVGMNLFLASYRFDEPLTRIYRSVLPFLVILLGGVLLITYLPALTLALVR
ncbi:MAG: TRAP transporter large permease subunit [Bryobacterales bacterium]|nr:TRAP transporter large permease subunit [Bryobacterales bacterium]